MKNFTYDYTQALKRFQEKRRLIIAAKIRDGVYQPVEGLSELSPAEKAKTKSRVKKPGGRSLNA